MKLFTLMTLLMSSLAATAFAKSEKMNAIFMEAKDLKWEAAPVPGISMATVEGDPMKGSHHAFHKFNAGVSVPQHYHSADAFVTVLAGTLIVTVDNVERRLPSGSFYILKNKQAHSTMCAAPSECLLMVEAKGKWDVVPEKQNTIGSTK
ncbi:cupin domain-containing protein [Pseudobdellovibrio sp. HCB154]|uniref:cupin domain-containing protein n=1 Tax=Pseudobdellovibrio sp. HCB154 TaxID=3386277 RepID=UPI003916E446